MRKGGIILRLPTPLLIRAARTIQQVSQAEEIAVAASVLANALDRCDGPFPPGTVRDLGRLLFEGPLTPAARLKLARTLASVREIDNSIRARRVLRNEGSSIEHVTVAAIVLAGSPHIGYVSAVDLRAVLERIRAHGLGDGPLFDLLAVIDRRWHEEDGSP